MEEDQKLFDLCTQNYNKQRELEKERLEEKQNKWKSLEKLARKNPQVILTNFDFKSLCKTIFRFYEF